MNEKVVKHKAICDELNQLYARKNHDYGDSFHQTFVEEGMAMPRIRLGDKFSAGHVPGGRRYGHGLHCDDRCADVLRKGKLDSWRLP